MTGNKFKDTPMCCGTPLQGDRCVHCHDYYGDNEHIKHPHSNEGRLSPDLTGLIKKKTCRIYCNLNNDWVLLWYDLSERVYPFYKNADSKVDLIEWAISKGFTHYFDEYTNNLIPLFEEE